MDADFSNVDFPNIDSVTDTFENVSRTTCSALVAMSGRSVKTDGPGDSSYKNAFFRGAKDDNHARVHSATTLRAKKQQHVLHHGVSIMSTILAASSRTAVSVAVACDWPISGANADCDDRCRCRSRIGMW